LELDSVVTFEPPVPYDCIPEVVSGYDVALAHVPDLPADWHYHPTLKVLEYRALGLPIIATDVEPNRKVVEDGANGLLVRNSAASLAEGMLRFVTDREFLEQCQGRAASMRQGTSWRQVAEMYERDVYRQLLEH
jgi:glycosyltransferase involved in cell wall biosynthesis